jgi:shikimate 5-dehydrogenase
MVIAQAAAAFEVFTGRKADTARMRSSFSQN